MSEEHRTKIGNSKILNHLIEHAVGEREMTATQANTGLALLRKVMPDLSAITHSGDEENPVVTKEVGGASKLTAFLETLAERSGTTGPTDAE